MWIGTMEEWEVHGGVDLGNAERTGSLVQPCQSTASLGGEAYQQLRYIRIITESLYRVRF